MRREEVSRGRPRALQYLEGGREGETCIANGVVGYEKEKKRQKSQKVSLGPTPQGF